MAHRCHSAEKFAELFTETVQHASPHFSSYKRMLSRDQTEYARLLFTALLFPLSASHGIAAATPEDPIFDIIAKAHEVFLSRLRNPDQRVTLGDYVIWRIEREAVCRILQERFKQRIDASGFASHQIRYGLMARVVADIRKRAFLIDIEYGVKSASTEQPKDGLMSILLSLATSFTRYVLTIDPTNPQNTQATVDRYRTSIGLASQIVGDIYFRLVDECKATRG